MVVATSAHGSLHAVLAGIHTIQRRVTENSWLTVASWWGLAGSQVR